MNQSQRLSSGPIRELRLTGPMLGQMVTIVTGSKRLSCTIRYLYLPT